MLSLVADYDTTSSSSGEDEDDYTHNDDAQGKNSKKYSSTIRRPSPPLLLPSANSIFNEGSFKPPGDVFSNPFLEAEKLEMDKLQKHVKMVESENHLLQKNGRKICWNNRKGRCRFGNKCKYAHDSDLVESKEATNEQILNKKLKTPAITKSVSTFGFHTTEPDEANSSSENCKPRKRQGLGDGIVPGKRVMKIYHSTKKSTL